MAWIDNEGNVRDEGNPMRDDFIRYDVEALRNEVQSLKEMLELQNKVNDEATHLLRKALAVLPKNHDVAIKIKEYLSA